MEYGLIIQYQVQRNVMWEEHKFKEYFDSHRHKNLCLYIVRFSMIGKATIVYQSTNMFRCGLVH